MKEYKRETVSKIISLVNKNILLPDIQRPFVWDEQQVYKLFDSLMRGYPISTFLFWDLTIEQLEATEEKENLRIKMYKFVDSNEKDNEEELSAAAITSTAAWSARCRWMPRASSAPTS